MHPDPKPKRIRLKGKALHDLYNAVWVRDKGLCNCGKWVEQGTPPHHVIPRSKGGADTMDNLVTICNECHYRIHHG